MIGRIDGSTIFLSEDQLPAITLSVQGLTDPSQLRGPRSSTMRLLNTMELRRVIGGEGMRVPSRAGRPELIIGEGGVHLFRSDVVPVRFDRDEAEAIAVSENASWFDWAKKTKLNELDLGNSPAVTATYQRDSWTDEDSLLHFPLVNYGGLDGRTSAYDVLVNELRPAYRVHRLLSQAFGSIGHRVEARGRLRREWKKFGILQPTEKLKASAAFLASQSATLSTASGYSYVPGADTVVPTDTIDSDPSGIAAVDSITPMQAHRYRVTFSAEVGITRTSVNYPYRLLVLVRNLTALSSVVQHIREVPIGTSFEMVKFTDQVLGEFTAVPGNQYGVTIVAVVSGPSPYTVNIADIEVKWECVVADYIDGISFVLNSCLPDWSVMDLLSGLVKNRTLVVQTDPTSSTVNLWRSDDYYRTPAPGTRTRDWTARMDHSIAPAKERKEVPIRIQYRMAEDRDDATVAIIQQVAPAPGYGNANVELGGYGKETTVNVPWPATAMDFIMDGMRVPTMRDKGAAYQENVFDREGRFLILDGVRNDGEWTHDGALLTEYPVAYFSYPGDRAIPVGFDNTLCIGDERTVGTIEAYGDKTHRMLSESRCLEAYFFIKDHELQMFDHGAPTLVDDGTGKAWYYVQEISGHRFGKGLPTKCTLVEIPGTRVDAEAVTPPVTAVSYPPLIDLPPFVPPCTNAPRWPIAPVLVSHVVSATDQAAVEADPTTYPIGMRLAIVCLAGGGGGEWDNWTGSVVQRVAPGTGTDGTQWQRIIPADYALVEKADWSTATGYDRYLIVEVPTTIISGTYPSGRTMFHYFYPLELMDAGGNWVLVGQINPCAESTITVGEPGDSCRTMQIQVNTTTDPSAGWADVGDELFVTPSAGTVTLPPGAMYARMKYMRGTNVQGYSDRIAIV